MLEIQSNLDEMEQSICNTTTNDKFINQAIDIKKQREIIVVFDNIVFELVIFMRATILSHFFNNQNQ